MDSFLLRGWYLLAVTLILVGITPLQASAVMQSLNGLSGQDQTFANDTNVIVSSSGSTHTLGWSGILSFLRGGTGTSTFAIGGLVFSDGTKLTQNPSKLFWDNSNGFLGIGTTTPSAGVHVASGVLKVDGTHPALIYGDEVTYSKLHLLNVDQTILLDRSADIEFRDLSGSTLGHLYSPTSGALGFEQGSGLAGASGFLDFSQLTNSDKNYVFPDYSGTIGLLEADQMWTGLNKFEASTNSTVYIGSAIKSGCLVIGDSDGVGVTYVTANDGVLIATTSQPDICQ